MFHGILFTMTHDTSISRRTLQHYEDHAWSFREGTWDHDVSQNRHALMKALETTRTPHILDFGCGPGRDLCAFLAMGAQVTGLDGCETFVEMAREVSGVPVLKQDFLSLDLPHEAFDGIFANATLFHVPAFELPRVLGELNSALKPGGVLFASIPRGSDEEGWNGERYGRYHAPKSWDALLENTGFAKLDSFFRPEGMPREQQPWYASVWRKPIT